jgi:hypothetical protein
MSLIDINTATNQMINEAILDFYNQASIRKDKYLGSPEHLCHLTAQLEYISLSHLAYLPHTLYEANRGAYEKQVREAEAILNALATRRGTNINLPAFIRGSDNIVALETCFEISNADIEFILIFNRLEHTCLQGYKACRPCKSVTILDTCTAYTKAIGDSVTSAVLLLRFDQELKN